jgi:hypothetical protein
MNPITIHLEPDVALFYTRIALTSGTSLEQVLQDALFKLAGELSLEALVVDKRFTALFTDEEANNALMRLLDAGYKF